MLIRDFHGVKDGVEPVETSRRIIAALRQADGRPLNEEHPEVGLGIASVLFCVSGSIQAHRQRRNNSNFVFPQCRPTDLSRGDFGLPHRRE